MNNSKSHFKFLNIRIIIPYKSVGLESDANIYLKTIKKINKHAKVIVSNSNDLNDVLKSGNFIDDVHIYISNADKKWFEHCHKKYFMVNHELFYQNPNDADILNKIDVALCRTNVGSQWAEKIKTEQKFSYQIKETKFTTFFQERHIVKHWNILLHSAGEHHWKQTDAIIKAWQLYPDLPFIVITCTNQCLRNIENLLKKGGYPKNMHLHKKLIDNEDFILIKNKIGMHLCPSIVEGYGHYINEARKIKSLVITTNMAPMNELIDKTCGILIDCSSYGTKKNGSQLCFVTEKNIYDAVMVAYHMSIDDRKKMAEIAYDKFINDTLTFESSIVDMLN